MMTYIYMSVCVNKLVCSSGNICSYLAQDTKGDSKNAKKKNNKKTSKNKSSLSRANKKKPGMPNVSNDLSQKLYATMEKHKEVFCGEIIHHVTLDVCLSIASN